MKRLREWTARFGGLLGKRRKDRELDDEIESHLQLHAEDNLRSGMTPEEARRQAVVKLGGIESTKEAYRDQRGLPLLETIWQDFRYGARQFWKNPGFTVVAALTLALGIGATTAITSVVRTALFDPVPVARPDRLLVLKARDRERGWTTPGLNPVAARDVEAATNLFSRTVFWEMDSLTLERGTFPQDIGGSRVSREFFNLFSVPPTLGRLPSVDDMAPGAPPVLVLSHPLWRKVFGGDPSIVGQSVRFKQATATVIGVMPPHFLFPARLAIGGLGPARTRWRARSWTRQRAWVRNRWPTRA
jgi:hypothetical protein